MEKFRKRLNPKPKKDNNGNLIKNKLKLWHGLLRSKNANQDNNSSKFMLMNRDYNGSMNIRNKALCILENKELPEFLKRKQNQPGYIDRYSGACGKRQANCISMDKSSQPATHFTQCKLK